MNIYNCGNTLKDYLGKACVCTAIGAALASTSAFSDPLFTVNGSLLIAQSGTMQHDHGDMSTPVANDVGMNMDSMQHDHGDMNTAVESDAGMAMEEMQHDHSSMDMVSSTPALDGSEYSTNISGLPNASPTETVVLSNGDSYDITASYVKKQVGNRMLRMLAYNGSVPGPFIKVIQNAEVTINFHNKTDVDQTIHSHGIRIDNRFDGVPGLTQDSVKPGESFSYIVKFRDAGVFWYHPHTREDYGQELGLYGNYLITPSEPGYWNPANREVPLVIDDILIDNDRIAAFYEEFTNFALLGRFGNEFLVNGQQAYKLKVNKGEVVRFFVTNVSNVRTYNLSLPGVQTKVVGADLGKFEHELFADNFLISPAERLVIETRFNEAGTYDLTHTQPSGKVKLATIEVSADTVADKDHAASFLSLRHNYDVENEFRGFRGYLDAEPDKKLLMTIELQDQMVDHSMHAHMHSEEELHDHSQHVMEATPPVQYQPMTPTAEHLDSIQWDDPQQSDRTHKTPEIFWKLIDEDTGRVSSDIDDWNFSQGEMVKIRITNDKNADHIMQHPVHFHGQQFVVLAVDGLPNSNMVWKDTVLIYPGQSMDILVKMSNPGVWMAHCHIAEHLHAGMMLTFRVEDEKGHAVGDEYRAHQGIVHSH